jgi:hypothetical protein
MFSMQQLVTKINEMFRNVPGMRQLQEKIDCLNLYILNIVYVVGECGLWSQIGYVFRSIVTLIITCIQWLMCICAVVSVGMHWLVLGIAGCVLEVTTWWVGNARKRIIPDRESDGDYLERYYLLLTDRDTFPFNVFVHKFLKSDPDDVHDHPWGFAHLIIRSGYWETVAQPDDPLKTERYWRGAGYYNMVDSNHTHKIELDPTKPPPITLFIPFGKKVHDIWGFYVRRADLKSKGNAVSRFIKHDEYFEMKKRDHTDLKKLY